MAIDRNAEYTIINASGVEVQVPGQVLIERALANEPDLVEGVPLREYVRQNVDIGDTVAKAHDQYQVDLTPLPSAKEERERIDGIRDLELQAAVALKSSDPDDDNLPDQDVLDNRDVNANGVEDRVEE